MSALAVASLHVHPVKSCRGHSVRQATLDARGFRNDRRLLIVDERGCFLTQRDTPRLALIGADLAEDRLTLHAPGRPPLEVATRPAGGTTESIVVWHDTVAACDLGASAAQWLTEFLGRPARLVAPAGNFSRPMRAAAASTSDEIAFQDQHPLLVISEASLADLNARLDFPLPMNRFRPNLVVRGAAAYDEDRWKRIRIGDVVLRASGPCARCVVTTTDQETLERGKDPLRTLALYRRGPEGEVFFGQNFIHETKTGTIAVGDAVEVLA